MTPAPPISDLQRIPGVGPSIEQDLRDLGVNQVAELRGANPEHLYERLCVLRGAAIDRCVLYVFRCAVYFASRREHDPELLKWWNWKHAEGSAAYGRGQAGGPLLWSKGVR